MIDPKILDSIERLIRIINGSDNDVATAKLLSMLDALCQTRLAAYDRTDRDAL